MAGRTTEARRLADVLRRLTFVAARQPGDVLDQAATMLREQAAELERLRAAGKARMPLRDGDAQPPATAAPAALDSLVTACAALRDAVPQPSSQPTRVRDDIAALDRFHAALRELYMTINAALAGQPQEPARGPSDEEVAALWHEVYMRASTEWSSQIVPPYEFARAVRAWKPEESGRGCA